MPTLPTPGDVSLSAEDKPPDHLIYRPPAVQLQPVPSMTHKRTPIDSENDDVDDDDDDGLLQEHHHIEDVHHYWFGGTTALKFLAAGGVAGAGQRPFCASRVSGSHLSAHRPANSIADIDRSVRSLKDISHNEATRSRWHFPAPRCESAGREGDYDRHCPDICRGWHRRFLGRQWAFRREDFSRIRDQVFNL